MENPLSVFISSVISGMAAERKIAQAAVEAIPLTRPWLFEFSSASSLPLEESYLSKVRTCDIFVLLLGTNVTEPVKAEVQTAQDAGKPKLVFVSSKAPDTVVTYAQSLGVKYAVYGTPRHLASKIAEAVSDELLTGYRQRALPRGALGAIGNFVEMLARGDYVFNLSGQSVTGARNVVVTGSVDGEVIGSVQNFAIQVYDLPPGDGKLSEDKVRGILREYLRWVRDAYDKARLFGLESAPTVRPSPRPGLTDVFIPLALRRFNPAPRWEREDALRGKSGLDALLAWRQLNRAERRIGEIIPLDGLLTLSDRIAIVGGAGSGKSTVLAYLAATLARAACGEVLPYRVTGDEIPIPIVVPLRYYRDYLDTCHNAGAKLLDEPRAGTLAGFITWYLRRRSKILEASEDFFDRLLQGGGCLLMIDGLDEVVSREQRGQVREEVEQLVTDNYPANKVIVTAREAGYREEAVFGDDFVRLDVQELDETQITELVENWCRRLYPDDVDGSTTKLVSAIGYINDLRQERDLSPLINTPLMTTMVVSVQWGETELPRERARLYEACVKAIIQAQYIPDDPAREKLVNWGGPWEAQRDWLSILALAMHEGGRGGAAWREEQVRAALSGDLSPDSQEAFLRAVRYRGGLFEERGELFQFMHLTFEEFLAARLLAKRREDGWPVLRIHVGDSWWREVFLLTYGYLQVDYVPEAARYLHWLSRLEGDDEAALAGAELAGSAVLEMERTDLHLRLQLAGRLVELLEDEQLSVRGSLRAVAGDTLARLGDPRPGVGLAADGLPDIVWCHIPMGDFTMGDTKRTDAMAWDGEEPQHLEPMPQSYRISKYPVTNVQFNAFVLDGGYTERWCHCWSTVGWRSKGDRTRYAAYGGVFDLRNHPVVGVSWHEAFAFCNWLSERTKTNVSLPTEAQWERAARGVDGRRYPWGREITRDHANYDEARVGSTTAVGVFPRGKSPSGALDMSGNVWEWCLTRWRENYQTKPLDSVAVEGPRVLRGGSCNSDAGLVRCASRGKPHPDTFDRLCGFRVAGSPTS